MSVPKEDFWYWINERHRIYLKKAGGESHPLTDDPILQQFKFTNVFRELDRTTVWVRENIRSRYEGPDLIFLLALFRQTGTIEAGIHMLQLFDNAGFEHDLFADEMHEFQLNGGQVFTGAYMVTGSLPGGKGRPKIYSILEHAIQPVWKSREAIYKLARKTKSIEQTTRAFCGYPGWGGNNFMAYEVTSDLRHTPILNDAHDIMTWANPGPGAQRGLCRVAGEDFSMGRGAGSRPKDQCILEMQELLKESPRFLEPHVPPLEMREIEHSLCEFDKWSRVKNGEGRPRSLYRGGAK